MSLQTFIATVEKDVSVWVGDATHFVEHFASAAWSVTLPILQALAPVEWAQAVPIILQALVDVETGNLADLETSVLNKASALGVTIFKDFTSREIQAIIGIVQAFHPDAPKPAPAPAPGA